MKKLSNDQRESLFEIYTNMCENYQSLKRLMMEIGGIEYERARAYWLAGIETGLRCEEYIGHDSTFREFLQDSDVIDEDEEFIDPSDLDDEDEDEDEEE